MLFSCADIESLQVSFAAREGSILRQYKGIGNNRPKSTTNIWMREFTQTAKIVWIMVCILVMQMSLHIRRVLKVYVTM